MEEGESEKTKGAGVEEARCGREKYRQHGLPREVVPSSGYPPSPCLFSPSLWLPSWPFGSVTPVSAAVSQPAPVTLPPLAAHTGGPSVVSGAWTSHRCCTTQHTLWRTKCHSWAVDLWSGDDSQKRAAGAATPMHPLVLGACRNTTEVANIQEKCGTAC